MTAILDQFGREYKRQDSTSDVRVKAKYDLAQTTVHNRRHWSNADSLAARAAMSPAVRTLVRKRSRYEADNNSWYSGILRTASNHIVSSGPRLQVLTQNAEANTRLERAWQRWCRTISLADKLRVMVEAYWKDGEVFAMRTSRPRNWPISLDIRLYEPEQCSTPWNYPALGDPQLDDGVRFDKNANEVEYYFYDHHPGETVFTATLDGKWYPAKDVIHLYRRERPGQVRGIPRATSSLNTLPIMRRQEMATLLAAETAASFATYLKSSSPALDPTDSPADFAEIEIAYNMMTTLPSGWEIQQLESKHPGPLYEMFQRQALMSFARCTNMPYALAAGTSKDSNFSSLKGDMKNVWEPEVRTEQNRIELAVIEPVWKWFLEDAMYEQGLLDGMPPIHEIDHQWYWPPLPNLDAVDSANAAVIRLSSGQSTLSKEHANNGTDYETEVAQMARDYGVTVEEMKRHLMTSVFKMDPATMAPAASQAAAAIPQGEYTTIGQRAFSNNQKRIRIALDQYTSGEASEVMTEQTLLSIGLTPERVAALMQDASDGGVTDETVSEVAL